MEELAHISVVVADRYVLFRHGLVGLLQEQRPGWLFGHAASLDEMLDHLRSEPADLVLLDLRLPGLEGPEDLRRVRALCPNLTIMVMSDSEDRATILACLGAGAHGYTLKSATMSQLLRAMETVLSGGVFAPAALSGVPAAVPAVHPAPVAAPVGSPLLTHLTDRQVEVFRLLSEGCATKTIARRLGLAVGTVKVHLAAIYRVLGAHSRVEAVAKARGGYAYPALSTPASVSAFGRVN